MIVMGDFNSNFGFDYILLGNMTGKRDVADRNDNGGTFVGICIGGILLEHRVCHEISWVSTVRRMWNTVPYCVWIPLAKINQ